MKGVSDQFAIEETFQTQDKGRQHQPGGDHHRPIQTIPRTDQTI
ncbi:hypothetical protein ACFQ5Q_09225 [Luteolibacter ambystomatis]